MCADQERCKEISLAFTALDDARGGFVAIQKHPTMKKGQYTEKQKDRIRLIKQTKAAFGIRANDTTADTVDNRNASGASTHVNTRSQTKTTQRGRKWIALHHYDPRIIKMWHDKPNHRLMV